MTKNQKIALGCGGAGCLGLIAVVVIGATIYFLSLGRLATNSNYNSDINFNSNLNTNSNPNESNSNKSNSSTSSDESGTSSRAGSSTSMSDDDKHKLFQAASMTADTDLVHRVSVKIGLINDDNTPGNAYAEFVKDHLAWAARNVDFIQSVSTPEKARAYVDAHIND
jgi:hypothetical protein